MSLPERRPDAGELRLLDQVAGHKVIQTYIALADLDRAAVVAFADNIAADFPLARGKGRILATSRWRRGRPRARTSPGPRR